MTRSLQRASYRTTFTVLLLGVSAYSLLQSLVVPVLPTIQHDLHTSQSTVTWVLTAYLLSASIFTPILGRVGDMVGKERMLVVTLVSPGPRLGAGGPVPVDRPADPGPSRPGHRRAPSSRSRSGSSATSSRPPRWPAGVGVVAAIAAVGGGAGIVLAGPIVSHLDYHWLFWIPLVITLIARCAPRCSSPSRRCAPRAGSAGWAAVLLSGWLVALLVGRERGPDAGDGGRPGCSGSIVLAVVLGVAWVVVESRSRAAADRHEDDAGTRRVDQQPGGLPLRHGHVLGHGFLPEFLQTPDVDGLRVRGQHHPVGPVPPAPHRDHVPRSGCCRAGSQPPIGSKSAVIIGSSFSAVAYLILAFANSQAWEIYLASTLLGVGLGLAFSAMSNLIVQAVPPARPAWPAA